MAVSYVVFHDIPVLVQTCLKGKWPQMFHDDSNSVAPPTGEPAPVGTGGRSSPGRTGRETERVRDEPAVRDDPARFRICSHALWDE
jgi:hypothetical protein